ncbi:MAG: hypothetical protein GX606_03285, partial [Elusimicrobia bacterium]|nr:hypothetical protein [Elusimicrobiota bacterium]
RGRSDEVRERFRSELSNAGFSSERAEVALRAFPVRYSSDGYRLVPGVALFSGEGYDVQGYREGNEADRFAAALQNAYAYVTLNEGKLRIKRTTQWERGPGMTDIFRFTQEELVQESGRMIEAGLKKELGEGTDVQDIIKHIRITASPYKTEGLGDTYYVVDLNFDGSDAAAASVPYSSEEALVFLERAGARGMMTPRGDHNAYDALQFAFSQARIIDSVFGNVEIKREAWARFRGAYSAYEDAVIANNREDLLWSEEEVRTMATPERSPARVYRRTGTDAAEDDSTETLDAASRRSPVVISGRNTWEAGVDWMMFDPAIEKRLRERTQQNQREAGIFDAAEGAEALDGQSQKPRVLGAVGVSREVGVILDDFKKNVRDGRVIVALPWGSVMEFGFSRGRPWQPFFAPALEQRLVKGSEDVFASNRFKMSVRRDVPGVVYVSIDYAEQTDMSVGTPGVNTPYGGIDLDQSNLTMTIKRDGNGVPLPVSQQDLESIQIDGLVPVILDIQPAAAMPLFSALAADAGGTA